jgi:hypothetical protein
VPQQLVSRHPGSYGDSLKVFTGLQQTRQSVIVTVFYLPCSIYRVYLLHNMQWHTCGGSNLILPDRVRKGKSGTALPLYAENFQAPALIALYE